MFHYFNDAPGYFCSTEMPGDEPFLQDGSQTVLHVESLGHALHAFINGNVAGNGKLGTTRCCKNMSFFKSTFLSSFS